MNEQLKARLLDLLDAHGWEPEDLAIVAEAAELGALFEREACAVVADIEAHRSQYATQARIIARNIRSRSK